MLLWGNSLIFWLVVIIVAVVIEIATLNLCSIWFAIGGLFALIAASMNLSVPTQLIIFALFSAVLLVLVRPFCRRFLQPKGAATNADRIVGQTGIVTVAIDNIREVGEVKVLGQIWTARSADGGKIAEGNLVQVLEIKGVKAIVKQLEEEKGEIV